jgi:hypothetical protein
MKNPRFNRLRVGLRSDTGHLPDVIAHFRAECSQCDIASRVAGSAQIHCTQTFAIVKLHSGLIGPIVKIHQKFEFHLRAHLFIGHPPTPDFTPLSPPPTATTQLPADKNPIRRCRSGL